MASFDKLHLAVPREYFGKDPLAFLVFIEAVEKIVRRYHRAQLPDDASVSARMQLNRNARVKTEYVTSGFSLYFHEPDMSVERNLSLYFFNGGAHDYDYVGQDNVCVCYILGDFGISEQLLRDLRVEFSQWKAWLLLDKNEDQPTELP